jgi:hypothetical protein
MALLIGCSSNETVKPTTDEAANEQEEPVVEEEVSSFYGSYQLADMVPITDGKKLTSQDETYIKQSKERTIGHTTLTFNEDGTFKREFPHPSGDGSIRVWQGTYTLDEAAGTLDMVATMDGKSMNLNFTIVEKTDNKLNIKTEYGQIFMSYVYTK